MTSDGEIADRDAALKFLFGRINYESSERLPYRSRGLKLDRMRHLLDRLGNPQDRFPIVHVAGTKGKGSTSAMVASILSVAGYRTGLYTSPHLQDVEERMVVDDRPCTGDELTRLIRDLHPVVASMDTSAARKRDGDRGPTYFELTTAAALMHFARSAVDAAVLEVGLGGRLDSTNVCQPAVCLITSISFDHMRQLGNTLALIAAEKAGIIKPHVPVITGVEATEPLQVIERIAAERAAPCYVAGRDFHWRYGGAKFVSEPVTAATLSSTAWSELDFREDGAEGRISLQRLRVPLPGRHQASNAALALAAIGRLKERGWKIDESHVRRGLSEVRVAARTEVIAARPITLIDAAHNVASIEALLETLDETAFLGCRGSRVLVFATSADKDASGMLQRLLPRFDCVVLTRYLNNPRFVDPAKLNSVAESMSAAACHHRVHVTTADHPESAWRVARSLAREDGLICVTGSFFLASEIRQLVVNPANPLLASTDAPVPTRASAP
jgi:dihydrofolate synthase/folylpolyglutamate synthase